MSRPLRIATWNVEWFTSLFDRHGRLLEDAGPSARYGVTRAAQLGAIAIVLAAIDPDLICIVEAPDTGTRRSTVPMLEAFAARFGLRCRAAVIGFANGTQQEIAVLYDPDRLAAEHAPMGGEAGASPRFDGIFRRDLDIDAQPEDIVFSKPPLELRVRPAGGAPFRLIGVHIKSKAPHGATSAEAVTRIAIENRRKQLAQCIWLRARVEEVLRGGEDLVVLGDFNDGPGLDEYERLFGRSAVEIVLGEGAAPALRLHDPHAGVASPRPSLATPATARFYLAEAKRYFSALLDFVMVSEGLRARAGGWRIWHPFDDPGCYRVPELREALLEASDHFPVSVDLAPGLAAAHILRE